MKTWVKTLGIISIILIILDVILMVIYDNVLGAILIFLPFFGIIIGFWIFGFLFFYLKKHSLSLVANIISICGLVLFCIVFLISALELFFKIMPFGRLDIAGWFIWPFQLIIIIFFVIATIIINKKNDYLKY